MSTQRSWNVTGVVQRVIDGDTIEMDLDLGWRIWLCRVSVRVAYVNCPELKTAAGKAAKARVVELCPAGTEVAVVSHSLDKYGRVLATVLLPGLRDLGGLLVDEGHAAWVGG